MMTSLKLGPEKSQVVRYKSCLVFAFVWSYYWNHPFTHAVSGIYGRQALPRQVKRGQNYFVNKKRSFAKFSKILRGHFWASKLRNI